MRPLLFALLLTMAPAMAHAQPDGGTWAVPGPVDRFTTDELGNLYVISGNEITLYDRLGKRVAHNSLTLLGPISSIDAFSSLKPMVFSREQGQLTVLDNTLSLLGNATALARQGHPWVSLACAGVQSRFWFFDERDLSLVHVEKDLSPVSSSGRLDQLLGFAPQPTHMEEADGRLYLVDPVHGVLVFDLFATYLRTLPITGAKQVQVRGNMIWAVGPSGLLAYNLRTFTLDQLPWPAATLAAPVLDARLEPGRLYRLTAEGIQVDAVEP